MSSMSDTDLMDAISTCCMTKQTLQARNAELYCTKQDTGTKLKARQYELIIRKKVKSSKVVFAEEVEQECL